VLAIIDRERQGVDWYQLVSSGAFPV